MTSPNIIFCDLIIDNQNHMKALRRVDGVSGGKIGQTFAPRLRPNQWATRPLEEVVQKAKACGELDAHLSQLECYRFFDLTCSRTAASKEGRANARVAIFGASMESACLAALI